MPIVNGYCTAAELKARLGRVDADDDTIIEQVIEAASRHVDGWCDRRFFQETATVRYYTAEFSDWLPVDDLVSVTSLETDADGDRVYEDSWASTDYDLEPYNAALANIARPYTSLRVTPDGDYAFPTIRKGVKITGTWGWSAVPDAVTEATILHATRLFRRKDSPYGVAGQGDFGRVALLPRIDPDVQALLMPYVKWAVGAV